MTADLLSELIHAGIAVTAGDGTLRLSGRPGALTADLRSRVQLLKPNLLALLIQRDRLLILAAADGLPADLIHGMAAADLDAWAWFASQPDGTDATLRACLRTLVQDGGR